MYKDNFSKLSSDIRTSLDAIYCDLAGRADEILKELEEIRRQLQMAAVHDASGREASDRNTTPVKGFAIELKEGVRPSSFKKYAGSINAFATSTASLQKICRANHVPSGSCYKFMKSYYPEAAERHKDILEGRFAVTYISNQ